MSVDRLLARYHSRLAARDYASTQLLADVIAAVRHSLVGGVHWLATFEGKTEHERRLVRGHFDRLAAAVVAIAQA